MRWSNKIIHNKGDKSDSRISNRSLSKFKKINLQKSQSQLQSNPQLQKSELRLSSVEKIKPSHLNKSYISSYVNSTKNKLELDQSNENKNHRFNILAGGGKEHQKIQNYQFNKQIKPIQNLFLSPKVLQQIGSNNTKKEDSLFTEKVEETEQFPRLSINNKSYHLQFNKKQDKVSKIIQSFQYLIRQLKMFCDNIKKQLNKTITSAFQQFQQDLSIFLKQYTVKFQSSLSKMLNQIDTSSNATILNGLEKQKTQNQKLFMSDKFSSITGKEQNRHVHTLGRPHDFKNKFKQILGNNNEQLSIKNVTTIKKQPETIKTETKKLSRKKTNPSPRANSFLGNVSLDGSSFYNEHNNSTSSIRYQKIKDRSASKSVKRIQQKIVSLKKIFNKSTLQSTTNE